MTKQAWKKHFNEVGPHDYTTCPVCKERLGTRKATDRARALRQTYSDLGMVRVRGNLGGVYYE